LGQVASPDMKLHLIDDGDSGRRLTFPAVEFGDFVLQAPDVPHGVGSVAVGYHLEDLFAWHSTLQSEIFFNA